MAQDIENYAVAANASFDKIDEAVAGLETALTGPRGLADDIAYLNEKLAEIPATGELTPAQVELLAAAKARAELLSERIGAVRTGLEVLDLATERPPVPEV